MLQQWARSSAQNSNNNCPPYMTITFLPVNFFNAFFVNFFATKKPVFLDWDTFLFAFVWLCSILANWIVYSTKSHNTGWPVKHGRVFLVSWKNERVQCICVQCRTMNKSLYKRYQEKTAMFNLSPCILSVGGGGALGLQTPPR